jgi:hypothetical protein
MSGKIVLNLQSVMQPDAPRGESSAYLFWFTMLYLVVVCSAMGMALSNEGIRRRLKAWAATEVKPWSKVSTAWDETKEE